jgi:multiple sugar transport system substrate-binding protein
VVWDFAENKEGAKQFLLDLVDNFMQVFQASEFCNFPCFPKTVPDLLNQLSGDPRAVPPGKYNVLRDSLLWTKNIGYPGCATAGVDEVVTSSVIPRMFARVAKGEVGAEDSAQQAHATVKAILSKWESN